jgi:hypothetical protein
MPKRSGSAAIAVWTQPKIVNAAAITVMVFFIFIIVSLVLYLYLKTDHVD